MAPKHSSHTLPVRGSACTRRHTGCAAPKQHPTGHSLSMTRCANSESPGCGWCNTAEAAGNRCDAPQELRLFKVCNCNLMFGPEILTYNPTWRYLRLRVCELSEVRLTGFSEPRHGSEMARACIQPEDPASVCAVLTLGGSGTPAGSNPSGTRWTHLQMREPRPGRSTGSSGR